MASGNARGEDKRREDALRDGENEIGSINAACAAVGFGRRRRRRRRREEGKEREAGRAESPSARAGGRERETEGIAARSASVSANATERQQTHACATWRERSSGSSWTRGNEDGIRDETRDKSGGRSAII